MNGISVVKIGGKVVSDASKLQEALSSFASISGPKILVHGGGSEASSLAEQMGIAVKMIDGRRITDDKMLDVVVMVYGGLVNKRVVARLQALGVNALGLSGADGNTILSEKRPIGEIDYGFAGDIKNVNGVAFYDLLNAGFVPVFCALTHDGKGMMLNTNADTIASEIAVELSKSFKVRLIYTFELNGVLNSIEDKNSVIPSISETDFQQMRKDGVINEGMIPKIKNALDAAHQGVSEVFIGHFSKMEQPEKGTLICL